MTEYEFEIHCDIMEMDLIFEVSIEDFDTETLKIDDVCEVERKPFRLIELNEQDVDSAKAIHKEKLKELVEDQLKAEVELDCALQKEEAKNELYF